MTIALFCVVWPAFHCSPASPVFPVYLVSLVLCSLLSILSPLSSVLHCLSCLSDCRSFTSCVLVYFVSFIFLGSLVSKVSCRCGSGGNCKMPVTLCLSFICLNQFFLLDKVRIERSLQKVFVFNFCKCISDVVGAGQLQHVLLLLGQAGDTQGQLQSWRICVQVCAAVWVIVWEL